MRVRLSFAALLLILSASSALADKPTLTLVRVRPEPQTESCSADKTSGCIVYLGDNSQDVTITWKANHAGDKALGYLVNSTTCELSNKFENQSTNPYSTKDAEITFDLRHEAVKNLISAKSGAEPKTTSLDFKLCFEAGEHTDSQANTPTKDADARTEISVGVKYDEVPPKPPLDLQVGGLHRALEAEWTRDENDDVAGFRVYIDTECHKGWDEKTTRDEIKKSIQGSAYEADQKNILIRELDSKCDKPSDAGFPDKPVEVGFNEAHADLSTFNGNELDNNTVYFVEVVAFDRAGNENPRPDAKTIRVGLPIPSIGPNDIFDDRPLGCTAIPWREDIHAGSFGGILLMTVVFLELRRRLSA